MVEIKESPHDRERAGSVIYGHPSSENVSRVRRDLSFN